MGTGAPLGQQRGILRLDSDDLDAGHALLEDLADARDRATRADTGNEVVDLAVGVTQDLFSGGLAVDGGVRLVGELLGQNRTRRFGGDLLGLRDSALHALSRVGQHEFGAVTLEQKLALGRHRRGHRQDDLVAACRAYHGQRDSGVAAGRLDDRAARGELARGFGGIHDRNAEAVLDAGCGVVELELCQHGAIDALRDAVQADERGVSERTGDVVVDAGHFGAFRATWVTTIQLRRASPAGARL